MISSLPEVRSSIIQHSKGTLEEVCGLVVQYEDFSIKYIPCDNIAENPEEHFLIDPSIYAEIEDACFRVVALVHSHPDGPFHFSEYDVKECNKGYIPWILSLPTDKLLTIYPDNFSELVGKEFEVMHQDCYTLACTYYKLFQDIILDHTLPRDDTDWWDKEDLIIEGYASQGFKPIKGGIANIRVGDAILTKLHSSKVSHIAIYIGEGKIIHHAKNRLSIIEDYSGMYQKGTELIVRHNANNY